MRNCMFSISREGCVCQSRPIHYCKEVNKLRATFDCEHLIWLFLCHWDGHNLLCFFFSVLDAFFSQFLKKRKGRKRHELSMAVSPSSLRHRHKEWRESMSMGLYLYVYIRFKDDAARAQAQTQAWWVSYWQNVGISHSRESCLSGNQGLLLQTFCVFLDSLVCWSLFFFFSLQFHSIQFIHGYGSV